MPRVLLRRWTTGRIPTDWTTTHSVGEWTRSAGENRAPLQPHCPHRRHHGRLRAESAAQCSTPKSSRSSSRTAPPPHPPPSRRKQTEGRSCGCQCAQSSRMATVRVHTVVVPQSIAACVVDLLQWSQCTVGSRVSESIGERRAQRRWHPIRSGGAVPACSGRGRCYTQRCAHQRAAPIARVGAPLTPCTASPVTSVTSGLRVSSEPNESISFFSFCCFSFHATVGRSPRVIGPARVNAMFLARCVLLCCAASWMVCLAPTK